MSLEDDVRRFDPLAFECAQRRRKTTPIDLTARDFDQLRTVSPALEREGREAQRQAQLALVPPPAIDNTVVVEATPLEIKSAAPDDAVPSRMPAYFEFTTDDETMVEHCKRAPLSAVPMTYFEKLLAFVEDMNARNMERNTRLDTLEQRISEQDARILELEAQRAATAKVEV